MESFNFNIWYETYDPNFIEISQKSLVPEKWLSYQAIDHDKFSGDILKPINKYVEALYPKPELVSIVKNTVTLRQRNHAQIFLLDSEEEFITRDRPHMRQYYQTKKKFETRESCYEPAYLFYAPWFLDENIDAKLTQPGEESPFEVYESFVSYTKEDRAARYVEPKFIPFKFKRQGPHMKQESFGKIDKGSAMFDIVFDLNDILIEEIRKIYEKN